MLRNFLGADLAEDIGNADFFFWAASGIGTSSLREPVFQPCFIPVGIQCIPSKRFRGEIEMGLTPRGPESGLSFVHCRPCFRVRLPHEDTSRFCNHII